MLTGTPPSSVGDHLEQHLTADGLAKLKVYLKTGGFVSARLMLLIFRKGVPPSKYKIRKHDVIKKVYFGLVLNEIWQKMVNIFLHKESKEVAVLHLRL